MDLLAVIDDFVKNSLGGLPRCEVEPARMIKLDTDRLQLSTPTGSKASTLLGLLASRQASNIASHLCGLICLAHNALECFPSLANLGRRALVGDRSVNSRSGMRDSTLDEGALRVSRTEEGQVDQEQNPASPGERECRQDEADQKAELE